MNSTVKPIFNESFVEKCRSCEQCTRPIDKHISVKLLLVEEVVGPVHSARDPLTDKISCKTFFSIKRKEKKGKRKRTNVALEMQSKHILSVSWIGSQII